jgi:hypothetical protein
LPAIQFEGGPLVPVEPAVGHGVEEAADPEAPAVPAVDPDDAPALAPVEGDGEPVVDWVALPVVLPVVLPAAFPVVVVPDVFPCAPDMMHGPLCGDPGLFGFVVEGVVLPGVVVGVEPGTLWFVVLPGGVTAPPEGVAALPGGVAALPAGVAVCDCPEAPTAAPGVAPAAPAEPVCAATQVAHARSAERKVSLLADIVADIKRSPALIFPNDFFGNFILIFVPYANDSSHWMFPRFKESVLGRVCWMS